MNKKLGIIGGMGPLATNIFYERIIRLTLAKKDQDHIYTIIASHSTMPDRTTVILNGESDENVIEAVSQDLKIMDMAQVSNIAIPCNTFHYFYDRVQELTSIPIINMVDESLKDFNEKYGKKVLVLSTLGTKKAQVYERYGYQRGMEIVPIDEEYSKLVNDVVYRIKSTNNTTCPDFIDLIKILDDKYKPDGFILACTELSLIPLEELNNYKILDAMDILVKESIERSGYEYI